MTHWTLWGRAAVSRTGSIPSHLRKMFDFQPRVPERNPGPEPKGAVGMAGASGAAQGRTHRGRNLPTARREGAGTPRNRGWARGRRVQTGGKRCMTNPSSEFLGPERFPRRFLPLHWFVQQIPCVLRILGSKLGLLRSSSAHLCTTFSLKKV